MLVSLKIWSRALVMLFAVSAAVAPGLRALAGPGHGPAAARSNVAPARQCARRNTYNDIEYVRC